MPELPELEHFKRYFNRTAARKKIDHIRCSDKALLKGGTLATLNKKLHGKSFKRAERRGKFLIVGITGTDEKVIFHFGLTGFLHYKKARDKKGAAYTKVAFVFTNGDELQWINKRKFGRVYVVPDPMKIKTLKTMGPDASSISSKTFYALLEDKQKSNIKSFLMDQSSIAGIGNDYSNEILFQAGIRPQTNIKDLTKAQQKRLYTTMKRILKKAVHLSIIEREEQFPKSWLLAHKKDMRCPKNKNHRLKKATVGGRSAYYCPIDQS